MGETVVLTVGCVWAAVAGTWATTAVGVVEGVTTGTAFGKIRKKISFPRVASNPPSLRIGIKVSVIGSLAKLLLEKVTVPEPDAPSGAPKARFPHRGVVEALAMFILATIFSLHEIRIFAPVEFSVTQENFTGAPSTVRSMVVDAEKYVVMGSGRMLVSTETVIDSVWMPL